MWTKIINDFKTNARDIHTVPMVKREPKWFFVFVEDGSLYIESAKSHNPKSNIKKTRMDEKKLDCMLDLYHRRLKGEAVTNKAIKNSGTSVYWYGIFAEMNF